MRYNWILYKGKTLYTKDASLNGWYTKISDTFLVSGKIYKLFKPIQIVNIPGTTRVDVGLLDLQIVDEIIQIGHDNPNYDGKYQLWSNNIEFIPNRDINLNELL